MRPSPIRFPAKPSSQSSRCPDVPRIFAGVLLLFVIGLAGGASAADSAVGRLLVVRPSLSDPNFSKAVVLVIRHDANGAFGLIVNRFVEHVASKEILALFGETAPEGGELVAVHIGGPVQPATTLALHSPEFETDRTDLVSDAFAVLSTVDTLVARMSGAGPAALRILFGYAGWAPRQLDQEIEGGSWALVDATLDRVFADDATSVWAAARTRIRVDL